MTFVSSSLYQIGISVWYQRRRLIGQSMLMLSIQSRRNCRFRTGWNSMLSMCSRMRSWICVWRTYHSFNRIISTGFLPRSETGTSWSRSTDCTSLQPLSSNSMALALASMTGMPARGPATSVILPSRSMAWNGVRPSSRKTATSF